MVAGPAESGLDLGLVLVMFRPCRVGGGKTSPCHGRDSTGNPGRCGLRALPVREAWPTGFTCQGCGSCRSWKLASKRFTREYRDCERQTSVTAGTVMHRSHLGYASAKTGVTTSSVALLNGRSQSIRTHF